MPINKFQARHTSADGKPMVRFDVEVFYDLDEAANVLAQRLPTRPPRFGRRTAQVNLGEAAKLGLRASKNVDPKAVELYRALLIEAGVFPAGSASGEGSED